MADTIDTVMTHDPRTIEARETVADAARAMAESAIGDVVVVEEGRVAGILTDRDIVVRAVAEGRDPAATRVADVCSGPVATLTPDQTVDDAVDVVRVRNVHRVPVVQEGRPVGIVSLGDLAVDRDPYSALANVSAATPNL